MARDSFIGTSFKTEIHRGKSTWTKPILDEARHGSVYYELDTKTYYMWDGEALTWVMQFQL